MFGLPTAPGYLEDGQSSFCPADQDQARRLLSELPGKQFPGFRLVVGDIVALMTIFYPYLQLSAFQSFILLG